MRVYLFGIGGTGSRVLRSLTMLLASGVKIHQQNLSIVPIIIDTDAHNGDTARTRDLLRDYNIIRKTFTDRTTNSNSDSFFNTEIRSFTKIDSESESDNANLDVQLNFQNQDNTFSDSIDFFGLSQDNKDIIELFYNDSTNEGEHPELHLNLSKGFKGNPNIGSVVFNDLRNSEQFKNLQQNFSPSDRIFIISSIFGGTGASGFPTLVKLLRTSTNQNLINAKIGAITVMPYFNVDADDKSAINSALFDTKTKAALSYYAEDDYIKKLNALYYIADRGQEGSFPNKEGDKEQINNGHVIELISATSIINFINKSDEELSGYNTFEFGTEKSEQPFAISYFAPTTKQIYIAPLVRFAYASQIATSFIPQLKQSTFYSQKELNIDGSLNVPNEYAKLIGFFNEFKNWTSKEMSSSSNGRVFTSFDYDSNKDLNNLVIGKSIESGFIDKGLSVKKISEYLNKYETGSDFQSMPITQRYLKLLYSTSDNCLEKLGQLP